MITDEQSTPSFPEPFGVFRAEYLKEYLYRTFARPGYFPELETHRPCVLNGGRGTGKTTVLKCLSYDGKFELENRTASRVSEWPYYGFYYRVNTNRVTAFDDDELTEKQWIKVFGHYLNILLCEKVVTFVNWYSNLFPQADELSEQICEDLSSSLFIKQSKNQSELLSSLTRGRKQFESFLNNIDANSIPNLSLQGQPIDDVCEELLKLPQFHGKSFFFIIDEFENLLDYQQVILNTLIKHCGQFYTFKIGVKELGWRKRATLNPNEQLQSPADYERIDISERLDAENFARFAEAVCLIRTRGLPKLESVTNLESIFAPLSPREEATRLGVKPIAAQIRQEMLKHGLPSDEIDIIDDLELYFISFWARNSSMSYHAVMTERQKTPKAWKDRFENYRYAILYSIKAGKSGIRKYYCGWRTYIGMANGNIRYLIQLVSEALLLHGGSDDSQNIPISAEIQTFAAQRIGRKNLVELEGLSVHGAQLTKLLLGLGRVFESLAAHPQGHAPEYTQFHFSDDEQLSENTTELLTASVMHLALSRSISNKRDAFDLKSYDYSIHSIYSAFFNFSYRKKRKFSITEKNFIGLIKDVRVSIKDILKKHGTPEIESLPEQMQLFESYYNEASR